MPLRLANGAPRAWLQVISIFQVISIITVLAFSRAAVAETTLAFLNWSDYLNPDVVQLFQQETGISIKEVYFESDDDRDILITENPAAYDLILVSGLSLKDYAAQRWLEPIPRPQPENLEFLEPRWRDAFPQVQHYGVVYFWGTLGIAYRSDLVSRPIRSWQQLFNPSDELSGKIVMMPSLRELTGMALKALGYSANSQSLTELDRALALIHQQAQHVKHYGLVNLDASSSLVSGKVIAAMLYSGDALMLQSEFENISYVLPEEGGNIWVDYLTVSAFSNYKEEAWQFISFLNRPDIAAMQAEYLYYATPNTEAKKRLNEALLANPTIYPSIEALENSEFFSPLPSRSYRIMSRSLTNLVR